MQTGLTQTAPLVEKVSKMITASQTGQIISQMYQIRYLMMTHGITDHVAECTDLDQFIGIFQSGEQFYVTVWHEGQYLCSAVKFDDVEDTLISLQPLYQNAVA